MNVSEYAIVLYLFACPFLRRGRIIMLLLWCCKAQPACCNYLPGVSDGKLQIG